MKDIKIKQLYEIIRAPVVNKEKSGMKSACAGIKDWLYRPVRNIALAVTITSASAFSLVNYMVTQGQIKAARNEAAACRKDADDAKGAYEKAEKERRAYVEKLNNKIKNIEGELDGALARLSDLEKSSFEIVSDGQYCRIKVNGRLYRSSCGAGIDIAEVLKKHSVSHQQSPDEIAGILQGIDSDSDSYISDSEAGLARERTELQYKDLEGKACQILGELDNY